MDDYGAYRRDVLDYRREGWWTFWRGFWAILGIVLLVGAIMLPISLCSETVDVARAEFGPVKSVVLNMEATGPEGK